MGDLIVKLVLGQEVTEEDLANELCKVCDRVHSRCDFDCPVFRLNGNSVPTTDGRGDSNEHISTSVNMYGCACFKNGITMLQFIREASKSHEAKRNDKEYTLFWSTGETRIVKGSTIDKALVNAGIGIVGALKVLDFYEEGNTRKEWQWNEDKRTWETK